MTRIGPRRGPWAEPYGAAVVLVLLALVPYLVLTTALGALGPSVVRDTGLSLRALGLANGMANAAYAFGAVLAVQLALRYPQRRLLVLYSSMFVVGSVLAAWAPSADVFVGGHVLQGLGTGLMLIAAVPPLIVSRGKATLPATAVVLNLGLFGAMALGPFAGGAAAGPGSWRALFWVVAGLGVLGLIFTLLTFEDTPPRDPSAPADLIALALAAGGCISLFFGVSQLAGRQASAAVVLVPTALGALLIVSLLLHQCFAEEPLIPVRDLLHTVPIGAIVIAASAAAGSVALVQLTQAGLALAGTSPSRAGLLLLPEVGAAVVSSILFGVLVLTRWTLVLALGGLLLLAGGGVVLSYAGSGSDTPVLVGSALVGLGVGSSVTPALYLAGFSVASASLPRVFALIGLIRGAAAFLLGPTLMHVASTTGSSQQAGNRTAIWIAIGIVLAGGLVAAAVFALGRHRLRPPDVDSWLEGRGPAQASAPLGDAVRRRRSPRSRGTRREALS